MAYWLFWQGAWIGPDIALPAWKLPRVKNLLRHPVVRADAEALLFSAKTFAAAMLAYVIALRVGLPRPSWAIVTVYLVSQPTAGASLGRGVYRLAGTLVGAVATVAIVPSFANEPVVCSMVLGGWIGLCLFLSLLDRTPRAYAFVLAGYTASLIGFPAVAAPGAIFDTAAVRVQEIALGILCAVLVHRYVLPRPMTGPFKAKLATVLRDARRLAGDALDHAPQSKRSEDRHRLASDLLALRGLATHLPYDPVLAKPGAATVRRLHDRLARLLPLLTDIEERIDALRDDEHGLPEDLTGLLNDLRRWIALGETGEKDAEADRLIRDARDLALRGRENSWRQRLSANLVGHLAELIALLHDAERLVTAAAIGARRDIGSPPLRGGRATGYVFHRDPLMAARGAAGAFVGISLGCIAWIWSAWPDGGLAVSVLGVTCALFGNVDAPVPNVRKYLLGSFYGVAISLFYSFAVLPRVFDLSALVAVLAPAFLFAGSLQARPATAFMALGITLTLPILVGLGAEYGGDFAEAVNSSIALFVGVGFGAVSMTLFQTVGPDITIDRLLRLARRDVARRARGVGPGEAAWIGLMIDRAALLMPRLALSARSTTATLEIMVRYLRIGHAARLLDRQLGRLHGETAHDARMLLHDLAVDFRHSDGPDLAGLSHRVGHLIAVVADDATDTSGLVSSLTDLRFALAPVSHDGLAS